MLGRDGALLATPRRRLGHRRTDNVDLRPHLARLARNPGVWGNSAVRERAPADLRPRLLTRVGCPTLQTLDGYDRTRVRLPPTLTGADWAAGTSRTIARHRVRCGPVGNRKSPRATALGSGRASRAMRSASSRSPT